MSSSGRGSGGRALIIELIGTPGAGILLKFRPLDFLSRVFIQSPGLLHGIPEVFHCLRLTIEIHCSVRAPSAATSAWP